MKTLTELFELIAQETKLNEKYQIKFYFMIDTQYQWVNMASGGIEDGKVKIVKEILSHESIETIEAIQQVYWTIYNKGRVKLQNK